MNVKHPIGALHLFFIKNIFHDKMDLRLSYFRVTNSTFLILLCIMLKNGQTYFKDLAVLTQKVIIALTLRKSSGVL